MTHPKSLLARSAALVGLVLAAEAVGPAPAGAGGQDARRAVVAADGSGDFRTVQEAVDAIPSGNPGRFTIQIRPGTYRGHVVVPRDKPLVAFVGEDAGRTILVDSVNAHQRRPDGTEVGTFGTASMLIQAADFLAQDITFENSFGVGAQALAISVLGDRAVFRRCRFLGWQDTIFADRGRQYYEDCSIAGHVDFIFGGATAYFQGCTIHCRAGGYITAASTPADRPHGFVFAHCRITADPDPRGHKIYLGRPWRPEASVAFLGTEMPGAIEPAGWHNWGDPAKERTARYAEYRSTGPGARPESRVGWARRLTDEQAAALTAGAVLGGDDGWDPTEAPGRPPR